MRQKERERDGLKRKCLGLRGAHVEEAQEGDNLFRSDVNSEA